MSESDKLKASHLARLAVVYVRQSSMAQVHGNLESQRRQYALAEQARTLGFHKVEIIDQDLGRSASGSAVRPGFEHLVALVLSGQVGAVLCIEASRLARNGRDWHHLLDLCALCDTLLIDPQGVYDARQSNDRLLLGLKGSVSEFELSLFRQRAVEASQQKAARGELQFPLPVGLEWTVDGRIVLDPDLRVQQALRLVFSKLTELGSALAVLKWFQTHQIPLPCCTRKNHQLLRQQWKLPHYSTLLCIYKNPLYAGAYAYGKRKTGTRIVEGRALKRPGQSKPMSQWSVLLLSHHPGYIPWSEYLRNQQMLKEHTYRDPAVEPKVGRGGYALLAGKVRCRQCGRRMRVHYRSPTSWQYLCHGASYLNPANTCLIVGGYQVDERVGAELVQALSPYAIQAALLAAKKQQQESQEVHSAVELEREQARYQVELAAQRYEQVDPHNRLVALELERRWEKELAHLEQVEQKLEMLRQRPPSHEEPDLEQLLALGRDLSAVWNAPQAEPALKQRLAGLLLEEVLCDVDASGKEVLLVLHWQGGRHSEVRMRKPEPGQHRYQASAQVYELLREHSPTQSMQQLATLLNQHELKTGHGHRWDAERVRGFMAKHGIGSFAGSGSSAPSLSLTKAARRLGVNDHTVRRLITQGLLPCTQRAAHAKCQIPAEALQSTQVQTAVTAAIERRRHGSHSPSPRLHSKCESETKGV
jgi:DNA invertase Pin-like site-specific DNA recombinase